MKCSMWVAMLGGMGMVALTVPHEMRAQVVAVKADSRGSEIEAGARRMLSSRLVTVNLKAVSLVQAIDAVAASAGVRVTYRQSLVEAYTKPVSVRVEKVPLQVAFDRILEKTALKVVGMPWGDLAVVQDDAVVQQNAQGIIVGKVISAKTKQPVVGATVSLGESRNGVATGSDGTFRLVTPAGEHTVNVKAVGFSRHTRKVVVDDAKTYSLDIVLDPSASVLDEVVVTGTVVETERRAVATPIMVFTAADIERRGITRLEELFSGAVPGVMHSERGTGGYFTGGSLSNAGGAMQQSYLYSRGASQYSQGTPPPSPLKTYIDGVEMVDPNYLGTIDPASIERIEIITGPQAATVYGSGAMGGVMQIFTKRGIGQGSPKVILSVRYGQLQSSMSSGLTPTHAASIQVNGGVSANTSYAGSITENFTGQWQPNLFNKTAGVSLGANYTNGMLTLGGSANATIGSNGTLSGAGPLLVYNAQVGYTTSTQNTRTANFLTNAFNSQTYTFNATQRLSSWLQHQITVGQSITNFSLKPSSPRFVAPYDSLYQYSGRNGKRVSVNYNISVQPTSLGIFSSVVTAGASGSWGDELTWSAQRDNPDLPQYENPGLTPTLDDRNWGGFVQWRIGLGGLFTTLGVRAEHSPHYGRQVKWDWKPTNGLTYSFDYKDLTVKLMGSYGRATRVPLPGQREERLATACCGETPSAWIAQYRSDSLTPEYSSGPQGGVELYYGSIGSLTINHYSQKVRDLIFPAGVDSVLLTYSWGESSWAGVQQYRNLGDIQQMGWDGTASLNMGMVALSGTYSWNRNRLLRIRQNLFNGWVDGEEIAGIPARSGNLTLSLSRYRTSVTLTNNWTGPQRTGVTKIQEYDRERWAAAPLRLPAYRVRANSAILAFKSPGYWRTNLVTNHQVSPVLSVTLHVQNLLNSYYSHANPTTPMLGRNTQIGVSLRRK